MAERFKMASNNEEESENDSAGLSTLKPLQNRDSGILYKFYRFVIFHRISFIILVLAIIIIYLTILCNSLIKALSLNDKTVKAIELQITATTDQISQVQAQITAASKAVDKATSIAQSTIQVQKYPEEDFYTIALKYGTDKVTVHHYHNMYRKYLQENRYKSINILEIGLGCTMSYGPGASLNVWVDFFPFAKIYFIEYDKACAEKWASTHERVKIFVGDQANVTFLQEMMEEIGELDYVVDDGGHQMLQQITSFETLLPYVKSDGIYFIEDLLSSFWVGEIFGGAQETTLNYIRDIITDLQTRVGKMQDPLKNISALISSADCMEEVCAFTKRRENKSN